MTAPLYQRPSCDVGNSLSPNDFCCPDTHVRAVLIVWVLPRAAHGTATHLDADCAPPGNPRFMLCQVSEEMCRAPSQVGIPAVLGLAACIYALVPSLPHCVCPHTAMYITTYVFSAA